MTRDEIRSLEAGQTLDALVAEKVMGWMRQTAKGHEEWFLMPELHGRWSPGGGYSRSVSPLYDNKSERSFLPSTHLLTAVEEVLGEMHRRGKAWALKCYRQVDEGADFHYHCSIYDRESTNDGHADTLPLAICRAALLAVLEEE